MKNILCSNDIVGNMLIIPFFGTSSLDMVEFENPQKIVAWRLTFLTFASAQNEIIFKMRTKSFGHGRLKCPLSQIEKDFLFGFIRNL